MTFVHEGGIYIELIRIRKGHKKRHTIKGTVDKPLSDPNIQEYLNENWDPKTDRRINTRIKREKTT